MSRASELRRFAPEGGFRNDERTIRCLSLPMPSLHAVDLSNIELDISFMSTLATSSPRLACLRISDLTAGHLLVPLHGRLKSLMIRRVELNVLLQMLNTGGFTGLQALCAHFIESPVASPDCSTSLLPDLRSFYFQQDASRASVLELLDMLRLESFAFRHASPERPSKKHGAALMNLLTKRRLPLRELRMESIWMSDADLLRFLKVTPGLELLVIISGKTSDKIMSTLSSRQGRPARWLCPHLSRICIVSHESTKSAKFRVSKDALEELLIARWEAHDTESRHGASEVARISDVHLDNESVTVETMEEDLRWDVYRGDSPPEIEGILSSYQAHTRKHLWWMTRLQWGELS